MNLLKDSSLWSIGLFQKAWLTSAAFMWAMIAASGLLLTHFCARAQDTKWFSVFTFKVFRHFTVSEPYKIILPLWNILFCSWIRLTLSSLLDLILCPISYRNPSILNTNSDCKIYDTRPGCNIQLHICHSKCQQRVEFLSHQQTHVLDTTLLPHLMLWKC